MKINRPGASAAAAFPWEDPMLRLSRFLCAAGLLLVALAPVHHVRAGDDSNNGCNSGNACCGGGGGCGHQGWLSKWCQRYEPSVTYYAPVPYWFPNYFGPPYTSYQLVQYHTPPEISAQVVRARIIATNAANPALLPPPKEPLPLPKADEKPKEPLPFPKSDEKPPVDKLP
jgi:hypothetical protein